MLRLDNLFDAIMSIQETVIAVNSAKRAPVAQPNRALRPKTASQRLRARRTAARLDSIVQHMTGGG